ncbi:hypothetical protein NGM99_14345 [Mesorhizobium sp. RP14(2022)]|uniref:Membrane-anchored protein n=1 Tax=Mesorhizobium liriopis TaxID=2953882 RepID=A0ABT1C9V8_9HYPH|nr:hypothetical protein [Mesorhizobium liriopis]MCO6050960.1 hypothetical protein [Mesorhizobium liriopis]
MAKSASVASPFSLAGSAFSETDRDWMRTLEFHRNWAGARGLLGRPWFVLGSAPGPAIPDHLPENTAYIYVKYAGHSAKRRGLPDADLTLLLTKTEPKQIAGLKTRSTLMMGRTFPLSAKLKRLSGWRWSSQAELHRMERDQFVIRTLGSLFTGIGEEKRPSNGISLLAYALALGVPQIIIAGMSLETNGHDYNAVGKKRRHVAEDRAALQQIAALYPFVSTTEENLHRITGLPLYDGLWSGG